MAGKGAGAGSTSYGQDSFDKSSSLKQGKTAGSGARGASLTGSYGDEFLSDTAAPQGSAAPARARPQLASMQVPQQQQEPVVAYQVRGPGMTFKILDLGLPA